MKNLEPLVADVVRLETITKAKQKTMEAKQGNMDVNLN
jgi:hypothetical protein